MWISGSNISKEDFLSQVWRQKAHDFGTHTSLERACSTLSSDLSTKALLGLCKNELIESRLINGVDLTLELGPFELAQLPENQMLMIQSLESHIASISEFIGLQFSFLPRWRIDDVMATYANGGSSCGPHFDHYDVFLIQIRGEKRWQLDDGQHVDNDLNATSEIKLLDNFKATSECIQKTGDILYIPPKVGHWGIASEDCLTLSVGIRNPTFQEMISHFADLIGDQISEVQTMDDSLSMIDNGIDKQGTDLIAEQMASNLLQPSLTRQWFGRYMTELREPELSKIPNNSVTIDQVKGILKQAQPIQVQLSSRIAYQELTDELLVFFNGDYHIEDISSLTWIRHLEQHREVEPSLIQLDAGNLLLLQILFNKGVLELPRSELRII